VNCEHATLLIGADPYTSSPELIEHLQTCSGCTEFHREMLGLEANIRRALEVPPPASAATPTTASIASFKDARRATAAVAGQRTRPALWRGWALAASLVVAVVGAMWLLRPSDTLARDLVAHVQNEPNSWVSTQVVDVRALEDLLHKAGVTGSSLTSQQVTYVQYCFFRGHFVPHLVLRTSQGPVTVMVLPDEHVSHRETFHDSGYAGVIVPAPQGSLAVLSRGAASMDSIAQQTWFTVGKRSQP
jgi:hypothetical protein